jgi:TP901 family phage tail tape measure protein
MLSKASDAGGAGSHRGEQRRIDFVVGIANMTFPGLMAVQSGFANLTAAGMRTTNVLNQGMRVLEASMMAAGGFAALGLGMAVAEAAKFEKQMKVVQALIMDTADTPDRINSKMADLTKTTKEMAAKYGMAPIEVAKGLTVLGRAGVDTAGEMNTVLEAAVKLAKIEGITVQRASEMTVQMTTLFGGDYTRDAAKFAEILAHAANISTTSAEDIMTAMRNAGGAVTSVWKQTSVEEMYENASQVSAMVATLSQQGVSGSMSGTAIKSFINYMAKDMPKSKKALSELGLTEKDLKDQDGNFKKFEDILDLFDSRLTSKYGNNKAEWYSWFVRWGEPRQAQQYMKMMQEDPKDRSIHTYDRYNQKMQEEYDMQERVNVVMSAAVESFNKMISSMQVFLINVGSYLLPVLNAVAEVIGFLASNGLTSNVASFIALIAGLTLVFGGLVAVLRWLGPAFGDFKHMMGLVGKGDLKGAMAFGAGKDEIDKRVQQLKEESKAAKESGKAKSEAAKSGKVPGMITDIRASASGASPTDAARRQIESLKHQTDAVHRFNQEQLGMGKNQVVERMAASPAGSCHEARRRCIEKKKGLVSEEAAVNAKDTQNKTRKLQEDKAISSKYSAMHMVGTTPVIPGAATTRTSAFWVDHTKNFTEAAYAAQYYRGEKPLGLKLSEERKTAIRGIVDNYKQMEQNVRGFAPSRSVSTYLYGDPIGAGTRGSPYGAPKISEQSIREKRIAQQQKDYMKNVRENLNEERKTKAQLEKDRVINEARSRGTTLGIFDVREIAPIEKEGVGVGHAGSVMNQVNQANTQLIGGLSNYEKGVQKRQNAVNRIKKMPSTIGGAFTGLGRMAQGIGASAKGFGAEMLGMMGGLPGLAAMGAMGIAMVAIPALLDSAAKSGSMDVLLSPYARLEKKLKSYGKHVDDLKKLQNNLTYSTQGLRAEQEKYAVGSEKYNQIQERINSLTSTQDKLTGSLTAAEAKYNREKERAKKVQLAWLDARDSANQLDTTYEIYETAAEAQLDEDEIEQLEMTGDHAAALAAPQNVNKENQELEAYFASQTGIPTTVSKLKN